MRYKYPIVIVVILTLTMVCILTGSLLAQTTWIQYGSNPVLDVGGNGSWEDERIFSPAVIHDNTGYKMWYAAYGSNYRIGYATSPDGIAWSKYPGNPILDLGPNGSWDDYEVGGPTVIYDGTGYKMWYNGSDGSHARIGYATSVDGITWTKHTNNPVLDLGPGGWDSYHVANPTVLFDCDIYKMWYAGRDGSRWRIGYAISTDGITWMKQPTNPVLNIGPNGTWDDKNVDVPCVIHNGSHYEMWYSGLSGSTWRIGYAMSADGISWEKHQDNPVLDTGPGGSWSSTSVSYPYALLEGNVYKMWYSGSNGSYAKIGYATSGAAVIPEPSLKPNLSITSKMTPPGTSVTVEISIDDATGMAGGDILVNYDANILTINDVRATDLISGINLIVNDTIPGKIMMSMAGAQGIPTGSGALIEIDLAVDLSVEIGTETTLDFGEAAIYNELGIVIPTNLENGTIEITGIRGDVNQDGLVRANDAILTLRFIVEIDTPTEYQEWAADMNGDGNVGANDAILILRASSEMAAPGIGPVAHSGHIAIMLAEADVTRSSMTIPLVVDNAAGVVGGDILISYDISSLRAVEVAANDGLMAYNTSTPGLVRISFANANGLHDNTIAAITFNTLSDSHTEPVINMAELYDYNARPMDVVVMRHHELLPKHTAAFQNYPNPFNPETWIPYQLVTDSSVIIRIYSSSGQLVRTIDLGYRKAGGYVSRGEAAHWDGTTDSGELAASGIYYYNVKAGEYTATKKMIVVR